MTYKEYFERLSSEYDQASTEFHKFRGRLSKTRRHKLGQISNYSVAKFRFEETSKSYWSFLNFWMAHKLNPMDEYNTNYLLHKVYSPKAGKWIDASKFLIIDK